MSLRFRRSLKIAPGVRLNLTKTGWGMTVGPRGYHYSVHSGGRRTTTIGLPGTGLYWQQSHVEGHRAPVRRRVVPPPRPVVPVDPASVIPHPGLFASDAERAYHEAVLAYLRDDLPTALAKFGAVLADDARVTSAHLFAGIAAVRMDDPARAIAHLEAVLGSTVPLPDRYEAKYLPTTRIVSSINVRITDAISAQAPFGPLGAALVLAELYQQAGRLEPAIGLLQRLHQSRPDDPLVRLSLCDLLAADHDEAGVIEISTGTTNDSDVAVETLRIRAAAFVAQGHSDAAIDTLRDALAKTAGRDSELLKAVRYDRAMTLQAMGQRARARADFERIYATDPDYRDVAARLGSAPTAPVNPDPKA